MKEKVLKRSSLKDKEQLFLEILFFLFGFILSFAKIGGFMSPFCLVVAMSLNKKSSVFCFLGSILSITLFLRSENLTYLFIMILALAFKFFLNCNSSFKNAVFCAISFVIPNLFFIFIFPIGFKSLVFLYVQTILCALTTALCTKALKNFSPYLNSSLSNNLSFIIISVGILISFCSFNLFKINLGRFLAGVIATQILIFFGFNLACVFGVVATVSFALFSKDYSKFGIILTVSSFFSGLFKNAGKFFQILLFFFTYFLCCVYFGGISVGVLVEALMASLVGLIIPTKNLNKYFNKDKTKDKNLNFNLNKKLALNLKFAAYMLSDLQQKIKNCAKIMDSTSKKTKNYYDYIANNICFNCGLNTFCWVKSEHEIYNSFSDAFLFLKTNGQIGSCNMPEFLKRNCCKLENLVEHLNLIYKEKFFIEDKTKRINEIRDVAAQQFNGICKFLLEMSEDLNTIKNIDYLNSQKIFIELKNNGFNFNSVFCFIDTDERKIVELYVDYILNKEQLNKIKTILEEILKIQMSYSSFSISKDSYKISFFPSTNYSVEFAVEQIAANNNPCCGDSYNYFVDGKGFAHIVLSDGMGNGKRAAIDSLITCLTFKRFIECGFGFNSLIKLLNISFSLKSKEESLATIDCCKINLYTGDVVFKKAGATYSYIVKKGNGLKIKSKSLPIGILKEVEFNSVRQTLLKGDVVVMVSDGATVSGLDWILNELNLIYKKDVDFIAKHILKIAKQKEDKNHSDDITVIALKMA